MFGRMESIGIKYLRQISLWRHLIIKKSLLTLISTEQKMKKKREGRGKVEEGKREETGGEEEGGEEKKGIRVQ